jgi:hypothetical protein
MGSINEISCLTSVGNTGIVPCGLDFKFPQGIIIAPKGSQFDTSANEGNVLTTLTALFYNTSKTARFYPLYNTLMVQDQSEKKQVQTFPSGASMVVLEKFNTWRMQWFDGAFLLMQALRKFNGNNWDFYVLDNDPAGQKILGIKGSTSTMLKAIPSDGGRIWTDPWITNDATKITEYFTEIVFNQKFATDLGAMVQVSFDFPTTLPGLLNATLSSPSANATPGSFNIAITSDSGQDLAAAYENVLNEEALWTCVNHTTSASITIDSVTFVPGINGAPGYFTIAVATTAPPYPAAGMVDFNLSTPSLLAAAGADLESLGLISIVKS